MWWWPHNTRLSKHGKVWSLGVRFAVGHYLQRLVNVFESPAPRTSTLKLRRPLLCAKCTKTRSLSKILKLQTWVLSSSAAHIQNDKCYVTRKHIQDVWYLWLFMYVATAACVLNIDIENFQLCCFFGHVAGEVQHLSARFLPTQRSVSATWFRKDKSTTVFLLSYDWRGSFIEENSNIVTMFILKS